VSYVAGDNASAAVDAYIAAVPEAMRNKLQQLREVIKAACPDAIEGIAYGMPGFKYRGRSLVYLGAASKHYALYGAVAGAMSELRDELQGFDTSKGTLRLSPDKPLPECLITRIVHLRINEIDAAEAIRRGNKRGNQKSAN
jgi:uncharacterized protein YdhG (YjbR/CyaY superfamily)